MWSTLGSLALLCVAAAAAPLPPKMPAPWFYHTSVFTNYNPSQSSVAIGILREDYNAPAPALVHVLFNHFYGGSSVEWFRDDVSLVAHFNADGSLRSCETQAWPYQVLTPDRFLAAQYVGSAPFATIPADVFFWNNTGVNESFFVTNSSATIGAGVFIGTAVSVGAQDRRVPTRAGTVAVGADPTTEVVVSVFDVLTGPNAARLFNDSIFTPPAECNYP